MSSDEIRKRTAVIVRRGNEYYVGPNQVCGGVTWSVHAYDAWRTRDLAEAFNKAISYGAGLVLFNPVTGDRKTMGFRRVDG